MGKTKRPARRRPALPAACAFAIFAVVLPASAAIVQNRTQLTATDILAMPGKTLAITVHAPPAYQRTDRGTFWSGAVVGALVGPAAGTGVTTGTSRSEGKGFVEENTLADPSVLARELLTTALHDQYGLQPRAVDATPLDTSRPKAIAAQHSDVDFVLDVSTLLWQHMEGPKKRGFVRLWMEFQLVNVATRHTDAWMRCDTLYDGPPLSASSDTAPPFAEMDTDGGRILRHAYAVLAARCARKFASQRLLMSPDKLHETMALADLDPNVPPQATVNP